MYPGQATSAAHGRGISLGAMSDTGTEQAEHLLLVRAGPALEQEPGENAQQAGGAATGGGGSDETDPIADLLLFHLGQAEFAQRIVNRIGNFGRCLDQRSI